MGPPFSNAALKSWTRVLRISCSARNFSCTNFEHSGDECQAVIDVEQEVKRYSSDGVQLASLFCEQNVESCIQHNNNTENNKQNQCVRLTRKLARNKQSSPAKIQQ